MAQEHEKHRQAAAGPTECDVLLVIVLPEEWRSFLKIFPEASGTNAQESMIGGLTIAISQFSFEGYKWVAAALNPNSQADKMQGKVPSAVFTTCLLSRFSPSFLINVGIACRIHKGDCSLGDVVVATRLVDVTGNSSVEQSANATLKFRPGKQEIKSAEEIIDRIVRLEKTHEVQFEEWRKQCAVELNSFQEKIERSSEKFVRAGPLASGDLLSKSEVFHEIVKDIERTTLAYEMEAYAIAEASQLVHHKSQMLFLKGLSDDGDGSKSQLEATTKGKLRSIAAENALRLLRLAFKAGIIGSAHGLASVRAEEKRPSKISEVTVKDSQGFPYFAADDFRNCHKLSKALLENGRLQPLREAVRTVDASLADQLNKSSDKSLLARWLNCALDSNIWERVGWVVEDTYRLQKIYKQACKSEPKFQEHSLQVVNRLLIEHEIDECERNCLKKTDIITCLVENTGHHRALENFKTGFQRENQVVIDFDAVPLADLYSISNEEFLGGGSSKYDIVFHYHLGVWQLFAQDVVVALDSKTVEALGRLLIPEVEHECCSVLDKRGHEQKVIIPVNANSMVLVINTEIFNKFDDEFYRWIMGKNHLEAPRTWPHFKAILEFLNTKRDSGIYAIVPQGKRDGDSLYFEWCNFAYGVGGGVFAKNHGWEAWQPKDVILDCASTVEATSFYKTVYDSCPRDVKASELDTKTQLARFQQGDVAMAFVWSDALFELFSSQDSGKYSAHVIPGQKSMIGGGVCCVNKNSNFRKLAVRFVEGLLKPEVQAVLTTMGWCSGFQQVYKNPSVLRLPYIGAVEESLSRGKYMIEAGPDAGKIRRLVGDSLERIMKDNANIESVLQTTASLLRKGLSQ